MRMAARVEPFVLGRPWGQGDVTGVNVNPDEPAQSRRGQWRHEAGEAFFYKVRRDRGSPQRTARRRWGGPRCERGLRGGRAVSPAGAGAVL